MFLSTDSVSIPDVKNININMSLGLTLTRIPAVDGLLVSVFVSLVCVSTKQREEIMIPQISYKCISYVCA